MSAPKEDTSHYRALLTRSSTALPEVDQGVEALERTDREPIAIIGMGFRLPGGANDPASFWALLRDGVDAIIEVPPDRRDPLLSEERAPSGGSGAPSANPAMAFLLSSPRSGSTLLRVMLAGHPELFSPPELYLLSFTTMRDRKEHLQAPLLGQGLARTVMELTGLGAEQALALIDHWVAEETVVEDVYRFLQERAAPRLLVDKTPSNAYEPAHLERA